MCSLHIYSGLASPFINKIFCKAKRDALENDQFEGVVAGGQSGSGRGSNWNEGSYEPLVNMEVGLSTGKADTDRVGGGVSPAVLPHHRAYGSVHGGS